VFLLQKGLGFARVLARVRLDLTCQIGIRRLRGAGVARAAALAPAADSPDLAKNGRPSSISSVGCTGRTQALQGSHLGARVGETGVKRGAWQQRAAAELRRGIAHAGRRGRGGKGAGDAPYRNAELLGHLLDGGKRWSGGASGGRGAAVAGLRG
jgi:hypothetical protein